MSDGAKSPGGSSISREDVRKVALLSRLRIEEDQLDVYAAKLASVLGYVERLQELDLEGVEPLTNPLDATNRLDEDLPRKGLSTESLMKMAPRATPPFVAVPKVLGDGGGA